MTTDDNIEQNSSYVKCYRHSNRDHFHSDRSLSQNSPDSDIYGRRGLHS